MSRHRRTFLLLALGLVRLAFPPRAAAYLDPGTGSYLFQVLIAVGLGALYIVKTYWGRIKEFLGRRHHRGDE
jgi:hypothetical protein